MKITITEPIKHNTIELEATPAKKGWRIDFPGAASLLLTQETGIWTVVGNKNVNPELIDQIGIALHPIARYTSFKA
jgi:hypothetical protein